MSLFLIVFASATIDRKGKFNPLSQNPVFITILKKKASENIAGKAENVSHQHFSPFPTMFSTFSKQMFNF